MFLYTTLGTQNLPRAIHFYEAIFAVLGQARLPDWADGWAGWGLEYDKGVSFCLCSPFDGQPTTSGNGTMFAFRATSAEQVCAFHTVGLSAGGQNAGAPGKRDAYGPDFYVAYLLDPDGHKLACVFPNYDDAT